MLLIHLAKGYKKQDKSKDIFSEFATQPEFDFFPNPAGEF